MTIAVRRSNDNKRASRVGSAEFAVQAALSAARGLHKPPAHIKLRQGDMPFWDGLMSSRARDEWSKCDLVVAGQLARCQNDIEIEQKKLDDETSIIDNKRGTPIPNPRFSVLEQLARREMALLRTLRMGGYATGESSVADMNQRRAALEAQSVADSLAGEDLLA